MAQDPYSALASGIQNGMNMGMAYRQFQNQQEQKKIDTALTGMKLHMALLDPSMPKAANKVGMQGLIKMMSDPVIAKTFNINVPEGFDPTSMVDDPASAASIYKQAGPIFKKLEKGEIDKPTAYSMIGGIANELAYSRSEEKAILTDLRKELDIAYGHSPEARAQKVQGTVDEYTALVDAGFRETPGQARTANSAEALSREQELVRLGLRETPDQARIANSAEALSREAAMVGAGYHETPGQTRAAAVETDRNKRAYMRPEDAQKRITDIEVGRANFGKADTFTSTILAMNPDLAKTYGTGEKIPPEVKARVMKAYDEEEALLRTHLMGVPYRAPAGAGRKIVRTGTKPDGTRVAEYDDGSIGPVP